MKKFITFLILLFSLETQSQTYKDQVSFVSDLWTIEYAEEAVRTDSVGMIWVKRHVQRRKNVIYVDVSSKGTLIGIKFPKVLKLSSEGLENNGFIGEKFYNNNNMHIQSYAKDETGNIWIVTVGKDRLSETMNNDPTDRGRIYITIQDTNGIQSGWYFVIQTLGNLK